MLCLEYGFLIKRYALQDGRLMRKLSGGLVRPVDSWQKGRLVVQLRGRRTFAAEIAWILQHGAECPYPILILDGDECNLAADNLLAIKGAVPRMRLTPVRVHQSRGVTHPLSEVVFLSNEAARLDWQQQVQRQFAQGHAEALLLCEQRVAARPVVEVLPVAAPPGPKRKYERRPPCPEGWVLVRYKGEWLAVPRAVHPSDDVVLRCQQVLKGVKRFYFDKEKQMTLPVLDVETDLAQEGNGA